MRQRLGQAAWGALGAIVLLLAMGTVWTTPGTVTRGQMIGETWLNTYVRDNTLHLKETLGSIAGFFRGVQLRTHVDSDVDDRKVCLLGAELIVMSDGVGVADWPYMCADITLSGPGGLDTGTEAASTWYEVHAIRKSSDGTRGLLFHNAAPWFEDETQTTNNTFRNLRDTSSNQKVAQGFQTDQAAALVAIRVPFRKVGSPTGNMWMTIEGDSAGSPNGIADATSQKVDVSQFAPTAGTQGVVVFVFREPYTTTALTQYHMALNGDFAVSGANYVEINQQNSDVYARGQVKTYDGATWSGATADLNFTVVVKLNETALTFPSGYDQSALIGYVYNNSGSDFEPFIASDRLVTPLSSRTIATGLTVTVPGIFSTAGYNPPTLVRAWYGVRLTAATATRTITLAPAETGYANSFDPRAGGQAWYRSAAVGGGEIGPIVNESTWAFIKTSGDSYDIFAGPWEWIR